MRRLCLLLTVLLAACGSSGGDDGATPAPSPSTVAPAASAATRPCGLRPVTFANERWQGSATPAPAGAGVVWEQQFTFTNPNTVEVRLSGLVVHLRLSDQGGHFLKFARSTFRNDGDELLPAGRDQVRFAQVWLATGNTPTTEDIFATTSAKVGGSDCPVAIERITTSAPPAHVLALPTCAPQEATAAC
jgi:hypothetical protein